MSKGGPNGLFTGPKFIIKVATVFMASFEIYIILTSLNG